MTSSAAARKARRLAERETLIVTTARSLAEELGWEAVTTRRLADAIDYSQPVLYSHFPEGMSQIVTAVALAGMEELAAAMGARVDATDGVPPEATDGMPPEATDGMPPHDTDGRRGATDSGRGATDSGRGPTDGGRDGTDRLRALVVGYLDFAEHHPATYEAMFRLPIGVPFASDETPRALREGFEAICSVLRGLDRPPENLGTAAEVFWGALHGVASLQRAARFAPNQEDRRIEELVRYFST